MSTSPDDFASENQSDAAIFRLDEPTIPPTGAETPAEQTTPSPEASLPPEAQGEANGGPLGCCLGVVFGLLFGAGLILALSYVSYPLLKQTLGGGMNLTVRIVMLFAAIIAMVIFGQLGWRIGKKAYREYDPPVIKKRGQQRQPRLNIQAKTVNRRTSGARDRSSTKPKSV